jgi:hypothetical protein
MRHSAQRRRASGGGSGLHEGHAAGTRAAAACRQTAAGAAPRCMHPASGTSGPSWTLGPDPGQRQPRHAACEQLAAGPAPHMRCCVLRAVRWQMPAQARSPILHVAVLRSVSAVPLLLASPRVVPRLQIPPRGSDSTPDRWAAALQSATPMLAWLLHCRRLAALLVGKVPHLTHVALHLAAPCHSSDPRSARGGASDNSAAGIAAPTGSKETAPAPCARQSCSGGARRPRGSGAPPDMLLSACRVSVESHRTANADRMRQAWRLGASTGMLVSASCSHGSQCRHQHDGVSSLLSCQAP